MINKGMMTSKETKWNTPKDFFEKYQKEHNIQLDVCATPGDQLCKKYFAPPKSGWSRIEQAPAGFDGLSKNWSEFLEPGESAWCNPPYGKTISQWIHKAYKESLNGVKTILLLPSRTDTKWFHTYIKPIYLYRAIPENQEDFVKFIQGRIKFIDGNTGKTGPAPFPSMVVVFDYYSFVDQKPIKL